MITIIYFYRLTDILGRNFRPSKNNILIFRYLDIYIDIGQSIIFGFFIHITIWNHRLNNTTTKNFLFISYLSLTNHTTFRLIRPPPVRQRNF